MAIRVSVAERRARLMARHRLCGPVAGDAGVSEAPAIAGIAGSLVALHATDPATVYLSAWARTGCAVEHVDDALYARRRMVRMLGMRRTMFVVPSELVPVVQRACTDDVARRLRRQLEKDLDRGGVGDGDATGWLRSVGAGVLQALAARGGGATGAQLAEDEPRLRTQLVYAPGKAYGGPANITSRVLVLLAAEGHLVRGRRRGGWSSGQFEWFPAADWLANLDGANLDGADLDGAGPDGAGPDGAGPDGAGPDGVEVDAAGARAELARRWLRAFGPALVSDLQWWTGWTATQTKATLAALPVIEADLDGRAGVMLADGLDVPDLSDLAANAPPSAALLPALDPTPMGWQERSWYLGEHAPLLFDRTGNIGPTVWWAGRVVGGWAQRPSGEVAFRLLTDIGTDATAAVAASAAALEAWLGPARVTPRFRTPLERELTSYVG